WIVAHKFDQKTHRRVDDRVGQNHLSAELLFLVQPQQKEENDQHRERFVKLRGMQPGIDGDTGDFMTCLGKAHAPGQRRGLAPATSRGEATLTAQHISQCDSRRAGISRLPPGQLPAAHQEIAGHNCPNQSAVENAARSQKVEREKLQRMLPVFRLSKKHQQLGSDQRRYQKPETQVINLLAGQPVALSQSYRDEDCGKKSQRQKYAVGINWEVPETEKNGIHEKQYAVSSDVTKVLVRWLAVPPFPSGAQI